MRPGIGQELEHAINKMRDAQEGREHWYAQAFQLRQQRDALLAALEACYVVLSDPNSASTEEIWDATVTQAKRAIAKARSVS